MHCGSLYLIGLTVLLTAGAVYLLIRIRRARFLALQWPKDQSVQRFERRCRTYLEITGWETSNYSVNEFFVRLDGGPGLLIRCLGIALCPRAILIRDLAGEARKNHWQAVVVFEDMPSHLFLSKLWEYSVISISRRELDELNSIYVGAVLSA